MFCLNMLRIALELAQADHVYEDIAIKFGEHFLLIGGAMTNLGGEGCGLWDDQDNFYYDWLFLPSGEKVPLRLRSLVGLIPLFAVEVLDEDLLKGAPEFTRRMRWFLQHRPQLAKLVTRLEKPGAENRRLIAIARAFRMKRVLERMLDESEFLSPYGVRAVSRVYLDHPYVFECDGFRSEVKYLPAESDSNMFGGNSNWRGPVWMPINYLIIESLRKFGSFYGDGFRVECPKGSGTMLSLGEVADELRNRLTRIFLRDAHGRRPVFNGYEKLQTDPHFKDYLWFHEYFDGDDGRGLGASHQTGLDRSHRQPDRRAVFGQSLTMREKDLVLGPLGGAITVQHCREERMATETIASEFNRDLPDYKTCPKLLVGQKAVVTGSSSGIGKAVAEGLARAGAEVVINYAHDAAGAAGGRQGDRGRRRQGDRHSSRCLEARRSQVAVQADACRRSGPSTSSSPTPASSAMRAPSI